MHWIKSFLQKRILLLVIRFSHYSSANASYGSSQSRPQRWRSESTSMTNCSFAFESSDKCRDRDGVGKRGKRFDWTENVVIIAIENNGDACSIFISFFGNLLLHLVVRDCQLWWFYTLEFVDDVPCISISRFVCSIQVNRLLLVVAINVEYSKNVISDRWFSEFFKWNFVAALRCRNDSVERILLPEIDTFSEVGPILNGIWVGSTLHGIVLRWCRLCGPRDSVCIDPLSVRRGYTSFYRT